MKRLAWQKAGAFTLIELLVVVAIISVLVAMLMPVINRVRAQSRTVLCMSNLRQIGNALNSYAADNRGTINQWSRLEDYDLYPWYAMLNGTCVYGKNRKYLTGTISGNTKTVYRCPEMDPASRWPSSAWIVSVYGLVSPAKSDPADVETSFAPLPDGMAGIRLAVIRSPATYGLVFDTSAMDDYRWREGATDWSPNSIIKPGGGAWANQAKGIWLIHNNKANGLFADFHVESCDEFTFKSASNPNDKTVTQKTGIRAWKDEMGNEIVKTAW